MGERYWIRVAKRAFANATSRDAHWRTHIGRGAIISFVIGSGFFWAYQGWARVTEEWAIWASYSLAAGACLFLLSLLINFVRAPARMESDLLAEIEELHRSVGALNDRLETKLQFTWREDDNKYFEGINDKDGRAVKVGRVAIKNTSETQTIDSAEVSIINYAKDESPRRITIDKKLVSSSSGSACVDLHARREANFYLFRVRENNVVQFGPFMDGEYSPPLQPGKYKIKVTASAKNTPREDRYFFLEFGQQGKVEFRPWRVGNPSH